MTKVPDLSIERLARGELAPDEAAAVRAALGDDAQAQLEAIAADDAATLARLPPAAVASVVRRRLAADAPQPVRWWIPLGVAAAAAVAVLWLSRSPRDVAPEGLPSGEGPGELALDDGGDVVRLKGDAALTIDRKSAAGSERLGDDALVQPGDRLQLQYRAADATHGVIVSIDGGGGVTLHHPADASASTELTGSGLVALDHSYELDVAPGFERFFFVTARSPVDIDAVVDAARVLAERNDADRSALAVPGDHTVFVMRLRKSTAR